MILKSLLTFTLAVVVCSCSQQTKNVEKQNAKSPNANIRSTSGLQIENGNDQGITHSDSLGAEYKYLYNTSIITNDSKTPVHLHIALSGEFRNPDFCTAGTYKLFLLPKELTPDTATLSNNIFDGLREYIDRCLDEPYSLNRTLEPGEKQVVTIGRLYAKPATCGTLPNALFTRGDSLFYTTRDRSYLVPCGQVSYSDD